MRLKNTNELCSIILRTKNEERWINTCLKKISEQTYKNFEIIVVDNESTDSTLKIVNNYKSHINIKILKIKKYLPGLALNQGIRKSKGKYIVCLSAHCIPKDINWLRGLVSSIEEDENIAGVYGRQEPMNFTPDNDKRDLFTVFGLDKKVQKKDSFFHNANSIIRKSCWEKFNFDEKVKNIEDRVWAQEVLKKNYSIIYDPLPSVFHFHGIHQNTDQERLDGVINIFEKKIKKFKTGKINLKDLNIVAIIPVKGESKKINNFRQLELTINSAKASKYIKSIIVSTDNTKTKNLSLKLGAQVPFLRPKKLSNEKVSLEKVFKYTLDMLEKKHLYFDVIVLLEETFPFRDKNLIDQMLEYFVLNNLDCIVAAKKEYSWIWNNNREKKYERIDKGDIPRKLKDFILIGVQGLGIVTLPKIIRTGSPLSKNSSFYIVENKLSHLEIRDNKDIHLFKNLLTEYYKK
tara:strand:- start:1276 stop:2658 length:1383 start_codon:yes stop_codon:yes gene_type:complete